MALSVGKIGLDLVINQKSFDKQMSGIQNLAKKAGAAIASAFAVKKIVDFGKSCLELGSDLAEVQNVVDVTFPKMTSQVDEFAKSAATSFGLSETMAKQYTGTFGAMAKAFGFSEAQAYDMGTALTSLSGDVASFYNLSQDEAYTKLKSVFTGETESLKDLGVVMTQTALDSFAMANGFGKTTAKMSEAEKVALRYQFVSKQLSAAQGDFARTSGGWANQIRILSLQFDSLKATIGQGLINLFTPILQAMNTLLGKLSVLAEAFKSFTELITGSQSSSGSGIGALAAEASTGLSSAADSASSLADQTEGVGTAAKKAAKEMRSLMGFDVVNKLNDTSDDGDSESDSDSGAGIVPDIDFGGLASGETVIDKIDGKFQQLFENIQATIQPTIDALNRLWNEGLAQLGDFTWGTIQDFWNNFLKPMGVWMLSDDSGLPRFLNITNDLLTGIDWGRLKQSLSDFYTSLQDISKFSWSSIMDFYEDFLKPLAVWAFSKYVPRLVDCFTRFNNDVDWDRLRESLDGVWKALAPFAVNIGEGLLWFYENVLTPLGTWVANEVVPRFCETLTIAIDGLNIIIEALKPLFQWLWDEVLQPLAEWTGELFLKAWDDINNALQIFADWCAKNPETIQTMAIIIGSFFAAFKITSLISGLASVIGKMGGLIGIVGKIGGLIGGVLNPWAIALGAIITVGILVWKNWDTIKAKAIEIWGAIKDWFDQTINSIKEFFSGLWSGIEEMFSGVGEWFTEKFTAAYAGVCGIWENAAGWFSDNVIEPIVNFFEGFQTRTEQVFEGLWIIVQAIWKVASEWFNEHVTEPVAAVFKWLQDTVSGLFSALWSGICDIWSTVSGWFDSHVIQPVVGFFRGLWDDVSGFFSGLWGDICSVWSAVSGWFDDTIIKPVKEAFQEACDAIGGFFDGLWEGIKKGIVSAMNTVIGSIESAINFLIGGVNKIISGFNDVVSWAADVIGADWGGVDLIPKVSIPKLAQGGFVEKNTPQLAMIGDNRHQGEIVAPEDKLLEMAKMAASMGGSPEMLQKIVSLLETLISLVQDGNDIVLSVDSEELARAAMTGSLRLKRRYTTVEVTI